MKSLLRKFVRFLEKEWFLLVVLLAIGLIVLLFEAL